MRFSINQSELQNALSVVLKGTSSRSTLPILSGIYIEAVEDSLTLQATDLTLSIQYSVTALIEEEGRIVVPGKLFSDIVKSLADAAVHFVVEDDHAVITCDAASFSIKTLDADDFPGFPYVDVQQEISIPFAKFSTMVKKVARVVSKDESRAILSGVLITLEGTVLKMVATDSYRLAIAESEVPESSADDFEAIIAGAFLQEIAALTRSEEGVRIAVAENQIVIRYRDTVFINRRIEGNYPNYKQLLPNSCSTKVTVDTNRLVAAVKRASLLIQPSSPVRFTIDTDAQAIQISSVAHDIGSAQEMVSCVVEGNSVEIAFNYAYVLDGLSVVDSENVLLEVNEGIKPGIFKSSEGEKFLYLIMPVRI